LTTDGTQVRRQNRQERLVLARMRWGSENPTYWIARSSQEGLDFLLEDDRKCRNLRQESAMAWSKETLLGFTIEARAVLEGEVWRGTFRVERDTADWTVTMPFRDTQFTETTYETEEIAIQAALSAARKWILGET
jgi:hypothetical protein